MDKDITTPLIRARNLLNRSSRSIAVELGFDPSGYRRIEIGDNQPRPETARKIHDFFFGIVPLGAIFDPLNDIYDDWPTKYYSTEIRKAYAKRLKQPDGSLVS